LGLGIGFADDTESVALQVTEHEDSGVRFSLSLRVGVVVGFVRLTVIDVSDLEHDAGQNIFFVQPVVVEHVCEVDEGCIGAQLTVGQIPGILDDISGDRVLIQDHLLGAFQDIVKVVRDKMREKGKLLVVRAS
jgi:hypothetical protein